MPKFAHRRTLLVLLLWMTVASIALTPGNTYAHADSKAALGPTPPPPSRSPSSANANKSQQAGVPTEPPAPPGPTEIITKILQKLVTIKYPANTITFGLRHTAAEILTGEYATIRGSMAGLAEAAGFAKPKATPQEEDPGDDGARLGISAVTVSTARCKDAASANRMVFGVSSTVCDIGKTLTLAAVPLWTLSLALLGLAIVTRNAAAVGYSLGDAGYEFFRWIFICLCSGNGILIAIIIHNLFMALSGYIIANADLDSGKLIDHLMPLALVKQIWVTDPTGTKTFFVMSLVLIVIAIIIALVFLFIMGLAILARYVLTLALITMAPLAIATEGIPYMRFVFKDWLSSFLRVELLSVLNAFVVLLATSIAFKYDWSTVDLAKVKLTEILISILSAVGLLSIITAMNWSVFRYVFGTAIDMVSQMSQAAISTIGTLATLASGGALGTLAGAGAMAGSLGNSLGIRPLQGIAQGINAGQNALRQNTMNQRLAGGGGQRALPAPNSQSISAPHMNQVGRSGANSQVAQERAEATQRQRMMNAVGARDGATQNQVEEAVDKLSRDGKVSRDTAHNAATEAGADAKRIASAYGGDLNKAAYETGKANAGELVGSLAEERLRNEGKIARNTPAVFGEPIMAGTIAGILNDPAIPATSTIANSSNPPTTSNKPSSQPGATQVAEAMGARSTTDRNKMAPAIAAFRNRNAANGPAAEAALDAIAPQTRTLSASAGSLTQAARQLGFRDVGGLLIALAENEMAVSGTSTTQQSSQSKTLSPQAVAKLPGLQGLESVPREQLGSAIAQRGELLDAVMDNPSDLAQRTALGASIARMSGTYGSDNTTQATRRAGEAVRTLNAATGGSSQTIGALRQQEWGGNTQADLVTALTVSELDPSNANATPHPISHEQVSHAVPSLGNVGTARSDATSSSGALNTNLASSIVASGRSNVMSQQNDLLAQAQIAPAEQPAFRQSMSQLSEAYGAAPTLAAAQNAVRAMRGLEGIAGNSGETLQRLRQQGYAGATNGELISSMTAQQLDPSQTQAESLGIAPLTQEMVSRAFPELPAARAQSVPLRQRARAAAQSFRSTTPSTQIGEGNEPFGTEPTQLSMQPDAGMGAMTPENVAGWVDSPTTQQVGRGIESLVERTQAATRAFNTPASPSPSIASNLNHQMGLFTQSGVPQNEWPALASHMGNLRSEIGFARANDSFRVAGAAAMGLIQGAGSERELIQSLQQQGWVGSNMTDLVSGMAHDHAGAVTGAARGPTREQIQAIPGFSQIAGGKDANLVSAVADRARVFSASPSSASSLGDQGNASYLNEMPDVIGSLSQVIGESRANRAVIAAQQVTSMMEGVHGGTTEMLGALSTRGGSYANRSQLVGTLADGYATTVTTGKDATGKFGVMPAPEAITAGSPLFAGLPTEVGSAYRPIFNRAAALQGVASQPEEWRTIGNALEQLSAAYSPEQMQQSLGASGPAFAAMTQVAGGHASVVSRLRQAGWEGNDAGAVFTAMNAGELTRSGIAPANGNANLSQSSLVVGDANVLRQAFPELGDALRAVETGTNEVDMAAFSRQIMDAGGPTAFAQARQLQPAPTRMGLYGQPQPNAIAGDAPAYQATLAAYGQSASPASFAPGLQLDQSQRSGGYFENEVAADAVVGGYIARELGASPLQATEVYQHWVSQVRRAPSGASIGSSSPIGRLVLASQNIGREDLPTPAKIERFGAFMQEMATELALENDQFQFHTWRRHPTSSGYSKRGQA